jgi:hypothetical protein
MHQPLSPTLAHAPAKIFVSGLRSLFFGVLLALTCRSEIFINQVGFFPGSSKRALVAGEKPANFQVMNARTGALAHEGVFQSCGGDLGNYHLADFSALTTPGEYLVVAKAPDVTASEAFRIDENVYDEALLQLRDYFRKQRCGQTHENYLGHPCHLDDSHDPASDRRWDAAGGWHDASDLRKWVDATSFGLHGLIAMLRVADESERSKLHDELDWGIRYFLKMQNADGLWMISAALFPSVGERKENRLTDNCIGTADDRALDSRLTRASAQFRVALALAQWAGLAESRDPDHAKRLREAARRGFDRARETKLARTPQDLSAAVLAGLALHDRFPDGGYRASAAEFARALLSLQITEAGPGRTAVGHFWQSAEKAEYFRQVFDTNWFLIALTELLERFPDDADAPAWEKAVRLHADTYLSPIAEKNAFGLLPFAPYRNQPPGGRRLGEIWYRYFMLPGEEPHTVNPEWWVGINASIASHGVGLARAGRLLREPAYTALAQRQLDWIFGYNPFGKSTMTGQGPRQATHYVGAQPFPKTPLIAGGVRNGFGGDANDQPVEMPGSWQTSEYWTPMVGMTAWLIVELKLHYQENHHP